MMSLNSKLVFLAISLLAFAIFLAGLNHLPIPTVDGAVRASMAEFVFKSHQLWPIEYQNKIFIDHPPLFIWLTALSYKLWGVNDFAANLVPRFFAFLTVLLIFVFSFKQSKNLFTALLAAIILITTRDFILSSVRGYIEPVLIFFIYLSLFLAVNFNQKSQSRSWHFFAGLSLWLAFFSKGPVVLWPLVFLLLYYLFIIKKPGGLSFFLLGLVIPSLIWIGLTTYYQHWSYWQQYLIQQVLGSALKGRNGAQTFEPFYFITILTKFYWPWLLVLIWTIYQLLKSFSFKDFYLLPVFQNLIFALGFIAGFSLMKWKFWYYIAPAYPALALAMAPTLAKLIESNIKPNLVKISYWLISGSLIMIGLLSFGSTQFHKERIQAVHDFKPQLTQLKPNEKIYFIHCSLDHNMMGTSGYWYYKKEIIKENESFKPLTNSWIITDQQYYNQCNEHWCKNSKIINQSASTLLVYFSATANL